MKPVQIFVAAGLILAIFAAASHKLRPVPPPPSPKSIDLVPPAADQQAVEDMKVWQYAQALAEARRTGKKVFVYFEADWCPYCRAMKSEVLYDPAVQKKLKDCLFVVVNTDRERAVADKFKVKWLPSYLLTDADEKVLKLDHGQKTLSKFLDWLG